MVRSMLSVITRLTLVGGVLWSVTSADAGSNVIRQLQLDETAAHVELFEGMDSGQLQVKLVAKSANHAQVFIKNTTDAPLTVSIPKAAVGVHILPQFQGKNNFGGNPPGQPLGQNLGQAVGNVQGGGGQSQTIGGQMQPLGNQGFPNQGNPNPGFFGNAQFSIPAEQTVQLKMRTVCLNYGLPDPHLGLNYELRKVETVNSNPVLQQLLEEYSPRVDQQAMQAAAWHLSSELNWNQISLLPNPRALNLGTMFTGHTVKSAQTLVKQAEAAAKAREQLVLPPAAASVKLVTAKVRVK